MVTPDEVATALIDEKIRPSWDPNIKSINKQSQNCISVTYFSHEGFSSSETLKYTLQLQKDNSCLI